MVHITHREYFRNAWSTPQSICHLTTQSFSLHHASNSSQWVELFATSGRVVDPSSVSNICPTILVTNSTFRNTHTVLSAANTRLNKAPAKFRNLDYAERHGYLRGVVKEIVHDAGQ